MLTFNLFSTTRIERLVRFAQRRSIQILAFALLIASVCAGLASQIRLDTNLIALLPDDAVSVLNLKKILNKTESSGDLMVMIESSKLDWSVDYANELLPHIRELPWVDRAEIGRDTSFFEKHKLLYMDTVDLRDILGRVDARLEYEKKTGNPLYVSLDDEVPPTLNFDDIESKYRKSDARMGGRYYQNEDGTILILVIKPVGITSDLPFAKGIYSETLELVRRHNPAKFHSEMRVTVGGTFKNRLNEYETIIGDLKSSAIWVGFGILLLILIYFHHPAAIPILCAPLAFSLALTFALTYVVLGSLNLITVFLFIILIGLGIDFGIHMLARYRDERGLGANQVFAMTRAIQTTGRASLTASLTTSAAFFVLMFADFRGFSEFGFIAGFGLLFSAIAFLSVFPALVFLTERLTSLRPSPKSSRFNANVLSRHPALAITVCISISAVAAGFLGNLEFEYDLRQLRSNVQSTRLFNSKMRQVFTRPRDPSAILTGGQQESQAVAKELRRRIASKSGVEMMQEVRTLGDFIPKNQIEKIEIVSELKGLLDRHEGRIPVEHKKRITDLRRDMDTVLLGGPLTVEQLPDYVQQSFIGREGSDGELVFVFQKDSLLDLRNAVAFSKEVRDIRAGGMTNQAASEPLVYASMFQVLKKDAPMALVLTLLVVFAAIWFDLRKLTYTLIVLTPLAVGVLWMLGVMSIFGIRLNLMNAVVLPSVLGLGVDGGVHIFHRFKEREQKQASDLLGTASAVMMCNATSMIGFGGMLGAEHPGLRSIAVLALAGLGSNLVASVIFFPALLSIHYRSKPIDAIHRSPS